MGFYKEGWHVPKGFMKSMLAGRAHDYLRACYLMIDDNVVTLRHFKGETLLVRPVLQTVSSKGSFHHPIVKTKITKRFFTKSSVAVYSMTYSLKSGENLTLILPLEVS